MATMIFHSCHNSVSKKESSANLDIPEFIKKESEKLKLENPLITKTVRNGESSETKELKIANWNKELAHFNAVDLNKSSSTGFEKVTKQDTIIYSTPSSASANKTIVKVVYADNHPIFLQIEKQTENLLFKNKEKLTYSLGKFYAIEKKQSVKGLGTKTYSILGKF